MPSELTEYIGIVFDLDDTLISTSPAYYKSLVQMMALLYEDTGVHFITPEEVIEVYDLVVKMGSKEWERTHPDVPMSDLGVDFMEDVSDFPRKLVDTYVECCLRSKTYPSKETALKIQEMADKRLRNPDSYRFMPDSLRLLKYLTARRNVRLFLITAGPNQLQRPKIESRVIFSRFDDVRILPIRDILTKGQVIKEWQEKYDYITEWVVVGDSVPIDINPALGAGCYAIHVVDNQCYLAEGELVAIPDFKERYYRAQDMTDVFDVLARGLLSVKDSKVPFKERARSLFSLKNSLP